MCAYTECCECVLELLLCLQISFQHCFRPWPRQLDVNPAKAERDPQVSQEHQVPKDPWGFQATLAGVALLVIQDPLGCVGLQV